MGLLSHVSSERVLGQRFDKFVRRALETQFEVTDGTAFDCDFVLLSRDRKVKAVVEAKLHRSTLAAPSTIKNSAALLQAARDAAKADVSILVLNTAPDPFIEAEAKNYGVIIYDAEILRGLVVSSIDLMLEFEQIQQQALLVSQPIVADLVIPPPLEALSQKVDLPQVSTGQRLWTEIENLAPGRETAAVYEKCCTRALQYLFENDLTAWVAQQQTDTLHQFDLIARVSSRNTFWECLRDRFRGQYVVFEFKNYTDEITQAQIYTTEKYLYPNALRSVAIVLSRRGPDDHAVLAAKGALRESGKLILNASDDDLKTMLIGKDQGDEPSNYLLRILDEMLMKIER